MAKNFKDASLIIKKNAELIIQRVKRRIIGGRDKDKYTQEIDREIYRDAMKGDTFSSLSQTSEITAGINLKERAVEDKSQNIYKEQAECEKIRNPINELKSADSAVTDKKNFQIPVKKEIAIATGNKFENVESEDMERLRKEVVMIEEVILKHIEYTVMPLSGEGEETLEQLIKRWGRKGKTTSRK